MYRSRTRFSISSKLIFTSPVYNMNVEYSKNISVSVASIAEEEGIKMIAGLSIT